MTQDDESPPPRSADTTLVNTPRPSTPQDKDVLFTAQDMASKTFDKVEKWVLFAFHEAPKYQQDNHFILNGYRGELNSFKRCFDSIFSLHNETGMVFDWVVFNCSEYLVSSSWRGWIWFACGVCVVYLSTTISYVVTYGYCCFCLLFRWCSDLSWHERERKHFPPTVG